MLEVIKQLSIIIDKIKYSEEVERIELEKYVQLKKERVRLCQLLNERLFEIHRTINFAYANPEHRLPIKQYKELCTERQEIRKALQNAKWTARFE